MTDQQQEQAAPVDWRRRAEQAEELLRVAHETSNRSEAERARAVQRAEQAEAFIAFVADTIADHEGDEWADHRATTAIRAAITRHATGQQPGPEETCAAHDGPCFPDPVAKCPAHGDRECALCHRNPGNCTDDYGACGFWSSTGMHWDTCPNRVRGPLAAPAATEATDTPEPVPAGLREQLAEAIRGHGLMHPDGRVFSGDHGCCADTILDLIETRFAFGEEQAWCKTCRRVWEGKAHRCESAAENELRVLREDFAVARARLAEYENTINWHTTCTSCARVLDSAHRETERAEKAEQRRDELSTLRAVILGEFRILPGTHTATAHIETETIDRWRAVLDHTQEQP